MSIALPHAMTLNPIIRIPPQISITRDPVSGSFGIRTADIMDDTGTRHVVVVKNPGHNDTVRVDDEVTKVDGTPVSSTDDALGLLQSTAGSTRPNVLTVQRKTSLLISDATRQVCSATIRPTRELFST